VCVRVWARSSLISLVVEKIIVVDIIVGFLATDTSRVIVGSTVETAAQERQKKMCIY
jgi:hypothetical protein